MQECVWVQGFDVHKHTVAGVSACLAISHLIWFQGPIEGFGSNFIGSQQLSKKASGQDYWECTLLSWHVGGFALLDVDGVHIVKHRVI